MTTTNIVRAALNPQWTVRIDAYSKCYASFGVAEETIKNIDFAGHPYFGRGLKGPSLGMNSEENGRQWGRFQYGESGKKVFCDEADIADQPKAGDVMQLAVLNGGDDVEL